MKNLRLFTILICFALLVFSSCKKDKDKKYVSENSLVGSLVFANNGKAIRSYFKAGETINIQVSGIQKPEDEQLVYRWVASSLFKDNATAEKYMSYDASTGDLKLTMPDTTGRFAIKCIVAANKYYPLSANIEFLIVNSTSIDRSKDFSKFPIFTDSRDSHNYHYMQVGHLQWMMENFSYAKYGVSYNNNPVLDNLYGRYYDYNEAEEAKPEGWRLPSEADWAALAKALGVEKQNDAYAIAGDIMCKATMLSNQMWQFNANVNISNKANFYALPLGYATKDLQGNVNFFGLADYATFWTKSDDGDMASYKYICDESDLLRENSVNKSAFLSSVRYVRDVK